MTAVGSGTVTDHDCAVLGGVTVDVQSGGAVWTYAYPDLHGDVVSTATLAGVRTAVTIYDPFGDPEDPSTHLLGTSAANGAVPADQTQTGAGFGWEGSHEKLDVHVADIATIEMGARQYIPGLARFVSVDPVPGGNSNDYNYPNDPENQQDLTGLKGGMAAACGMSLRGYKASHHGSSKGWRCGKSALKAAPMKTSQDEITVTGCYTPVCVSIGFDTHWHLNSVGVGPAAGIGGEVDFGTSYAARNPNFSALVTGSFVAGMGGNFSGGVTMDNRGRGNFTYAYGPSLGLSAGIGIEGVFSWQWTSLVTSWLRWFSSAGLQEFRSSFEGVSDRLGAPEV